MANSSSLLKPIVFGTKGIIYSIIGFVIITGIIVGTIFIIRAERKKKKRRSPVCKKVGGKCFLTYDCCDPYICKDGICEKSGIGECKKNKEDCSKIDCCSPLECNLDTNICQNCPGNCDGCNDDGTCKACLPGWTFGPNKQYCIKPECPKGKAGKVDCGNGTCTKGICVCDPNWEIGPDNACTLPICHNDGQYDPKKKACQCSLQWEGQFCTKPKCTDGKVWYPSIQACSWCAPEGNVKNEMCPNEESGVCYNPTADTCINNKTLCENTLVCKTPTTTCMTKGETCTTAGPCGGSLGTKPCNLKNNKYTLCCGKGEKCIGNKCVSCSKTGDNWCNTTCCQPPNDQCKNGVCCTKDASVCPTDKQCCINGNCCNDGKCCKSPNKCYPGPNGTCVTDVCNPREGGTQPCTKACCSIKGSPYTWCCGGKNEQCSKTEEGVCLTYCGIGPDNQTRLCNLEDQTCETITYKKKQSQVCKTLNCEFGSMNYYPDNLVGLPSRPLCITGNNQILACQAGDIHYNKLMRTATNDAIQKGKSACTSDDCVYRMAEVGVKGTKWTQKGGGGQCIAQFDCTNPAVLPDCTTKYEYCPYLKVAPSHSDLACCKEGGNYTGQICKEVDKLCLNGQCGKETWACTNNVCVQALGGPYPTKKVCLDKGCQNCSNGGTWVNVNGQGQCKCPSGYSGTYCSGTCSEGPWIVEGQQCDTKHLKAGTRFAEDNNLGDWHYYIGSCKGKGHGDKTPWKTDQCCGPQGWVDCFSGNGISLNTYYCGSDKKKWCGGF